MNRKSRFIMITVIIVVLCTPMLSAQVPSGATASATQIQGVGVCITPPSASLPLFVYDAAGGQYCPSAKVNDTMFDVDICFDGTSADALCIDAGINAVGIGTSTPDTQLHVKRVGQAEVKIEGTLSRLELFDTNASDYELKVDGGNFTIRESSTADRLTIDDDGEVGIGTTSPSALLHVDSATDSNYMAQKLTTNSGTEGVLFYVRNDNKFTFQDLSQTKDVLAFDMNTLGVGIGTPTVPAGVDLYAYDNSAETHVLIQASTFQSNDVLTIKDGFGTPNLEILASGYIDGKNAGFDQVTMFNLGVGSAATPADALDITAGGLRYRTPSTPPSATSGCSTGQIDWDTNYIYVCVAGSTWKRILISTWPDDAYGSMWYHGITTASVTIPNSNVMTKVDSFSVVETSSTLVTASTATDDLTIQSGGAGNYALGWHVSLTVTGAVQREIYMANGIELANRLTITNATNTSPIVITSADHGIPDGETFEVVGVTGNTAANGSWIANNVSTNTIDLYSLDGTISTGNGAYVSGGEISHLYKATTSAHRVISNTSVGSAGDGVTGTLVALDVGDKVGLYVANLDSSDDVVISSCSVGVKRESE